MFLSEFISSFNVRCTHSPTHFILTFIWCNVMPSCLISFYLICLCLHTHTSFYRLLQVCTVVVNSPQCNRASIRIRIVPWRESRLKWNLEVERTHLSPSLPPWAHLSEGQGESVKKSSQAMAASFPALPFNLQHCAAAPWRWNGPQPNNYNLGPRGERSEVKAEMTFNNNLFRICKPQQTLVAAVQPGENSELQNVHGGQLICQTQSFSTPPVSRLHSSYFILLPFQPAATQESCSH